MSGSSGHVFISYVREDSEKVDQLQHLLEAAGIPVWRDRSALWPGQDWKTKIRNAITNEALVFLACFSTRGAARSASYQREELVLAIEQLRLRRIDEGWLIPVRLDECQLPDLDLGAGRTLSSIQYVDVFGDSEVTGPARLIATITCTFTPDATLALADGGRADEPRVPHVEKLTPTLSPDRPASFGGSPPWVPSRPARLLRGHSGRGWWNGGIHYLTFNSYGSLLVSAGGDGAIRIWEPVAGTVIHTFRSGAHLTDGVNAVAFSPDGRLLASVGGGSGEIRVWEAATGRLARTLACHCSVNAIAFSPDGELLVSAGSDGVARIWKTASGTELKNNFGPGGFWKTATTLVFSPAGSCLASAGRDGAIRIWEAGTGASVGVLEHGAAVRAVAFSPDGNLLASAGHDNSVRIWEAGTGVPVGVLEHGAAVRAVAFSPDGNLLASAGHDSNVRIWEAAAGLPVAVLKHTAAVQAVAFSPDGNLLASAGRDEVIRLWA
jgi:WD40 repeat protein